MEEGGRELLECTISALPWWDLGEPQNTRNGTVSGWHSNLGHPGPWHLVMKTWEKCSHSQCTTAVDLFILITLTGPQYWIDHSDPSSDPQSSPGLRSLPVGRRHNTGSEHYQDVGYRSTHRSPQQPWSRVKDTWNCPQGFEPSNGICQGKFISKPFFVSNLHCCYLWWNLNVILVVNVYFELILKFYFHWKVNF